MEVLSRKYWNSFCMIFYGGTILWTIIRYEWIKNRIFNNCLIFLFPKKTQHYYLQFTRIDCYHSIFVAVGWKCYGKYFCKMSSFFTYFLLSCILHALICLFPQWYVPNILLCPKQNGIFSIDGIQYAFWKTSIDEVIRIISFCVDIFALNSRVSEISHYEHCLC